MPIEFHCESCSRLLRVPDGSQGKQCQCPGCGKLLKIPQQTTALPTAATNLPAIAICIACPQCRHELICDPSLIGTKGQCRNCNHIFLISEDPNEAVKQLASPGWVFNCPNCNQLFEGKEGMRGRKGKCHVCGEVFPIDLKLASAPSATPNATATTTPSAKPTPAPTATPTATPASAPKALNAPNVGLSTMPASAVTQPVPQQPKVQPNNVPAPVVSTPQSSPQSSPQPASPLLNSSKKEEILEVVPASEPVISSATRLTPIQFACDKCQGVLEVPGDAANQITFCPFCNDQLTVPSKSTAKGNKATQATSSVDIFDSLPKSENESLGLDDLPPMDHIQLGMGQHRPFPMQAATNTGTKYIVCGILTIICAVLSIGLEIYQLIVAGLTVISSRVTEESIAASVVALFVGLALLLSIVQVIGGIAMIRRKGLALAKTAAIINCLPCVCINWPIGIWAAVITFSASARNDFQ